jgi:pumilio RNA-binding family
VFEEMVKNLKELRTDVYGNYVISHVLEFGNSEERVKITDEIIDDIVELSMHKFGSNVVEKCLQHSKPDQQSQIVDRLVSVPISHQ